MICDWVCVEKRPSEEANGSVGMAVNADARLEFDLDFAFLRAGYRDV